MTIMLVVISLKKQAETTTRRGAMEHLIQVCTAAIDRVSKVYGLETSISISLALY